MEIVRQALGKAGINSASYLLNMDLFEHIIGQLTPVFCAQAQAQIGQAVAQAFQAIDQKGAKITKLDGKTINLSSDQQIQEKIDTARDIESRARIETANNIVRWASTISQVYEQTKAQIEERKRQAEGTITDILQAP